MRNGPAVDKETLEYLDLASSELADQRIILPKHSRQNCLLELSFMELIMTS